MIILGQKYDIAKQYYDEVHTKMKKDQSKFFLVIGLASLGAILLLMGLILCFVNFRITKPIVDL
jgi:hypothetical protein